MLAGPPVKGLGPLGQRPPVPPPRPAPAPALPVVEEPEEVAPRKEIPATVTAPWANAKAGTGKLIQAAWILCLVGLCSLPENICIDHQRTMPSDDHCRIPESRLGPQDSLSGWTVSFASCRSVGMPFLLLLLLLLCPLCPLGHETSGSGMDKTALSSQWSTRPAEAEAAAEGVKKQTCNCNKTAPCKARV